MTNSKNSKNSLKSLEENIIKLVKKKLDKKIDHFRRSRMEEENPSKFSEHAQKALVENSGSS